MIPGDRPYGFDTTIDPSPTYGISVGPVPPAPAGGSKWIGALIGGIIFLIIGLAQFAIVNSWNNDSAFPDDSGFADSAMVIPVVTTLVGVVLLAASFMIRGSEMNSAIAQQAALEGRMREQQRIKDQEKQELVKAVKSTIMIRCRYCGSLNEENALKCASCGASL